MIFQARFIFVLVLNQIFVKYSKKCTHLSPAPSCREKDKAERMGGPGWQRKPKEHKMQLKTGDKGTFHQCKAADGEKKQANSSNEDQRWGNY